MQTVTVSGMIYFARARENCRYTRIVTISGVIIPGLHCSDITTFITFSLSRNVKKKIGSYFFQSKKYQKIINTLMCVHKSGISLKVNNDVKVVLVVKNGLSQFKYNMFPL